MGNIIVLATFNRSKLKELQDTAAVNGIELHLISEYDNSPPPEENGKTFEENALIKARAAFSACGRPVLAEDSGLTVHALDGEPGIYSARYCGASSDEERINCLLKNLAAKETDDYSAEFICSMVFIDLQGAPHIFQGSCSGEIIMEKKGENGFGYDPVFYIPELEATMAELEDFEKNMISHRAHAFSNFLNYYRDTFSQAVH